MFSSSDKGCVSELNDGQWLEEGEWQPHDCTVHHFHTRSGGVFLWVSPLWFLAFQLRILVSYLCLVRCITREHCGYGVSARGLHMLHTCCMRVVVVFSCP